jgi:outer membrane protein assembly factor BamB
MAGLIDSYVYIGIKGHVLALDTATGTERWRTKLKGSDFVHVVSDGDRLFAAVRGELYCLDGATGTVLWNNRLAGLGYGLASVLPGNAPAQTNAAPLTEQRRRQQAAGHAAAG